MSSGDSDAVFGLMGLVLILVVLYLFIVYVVLPVLILFGGSGVLFGGGVAIKNYVRSFRKNVAFESVES